jgi:hypothetical protein
MKAKPDSTLTFKQLVFTGRKLQKRIADEKLIQLELADQKLAPQGKNLQV